MNSHTLFLIAITFPAEYPMSQAQPVEHATEYRWPDKCKGKSYCDDKPPYYPSSQVKALIGHAVMDYKFGEIENRNGQGDDVASCKKSRGMKQIFMIKDKNDTIRFVPQTDDFKIHIAVEECKNPGKVKRAEYLSKYALKHNEIECIQNMIPFAFPVLSHDMKSIESEPPKDGISLGCSGHVLGVSQ